MKNYRFKRVCNILLQSMEPKPVGISKPVPVPNPRFVPVVTSLKQTVYELLLDCGCVYRLYKNVCKRLFEVVLEKVVIGCFPLLYLF